MKKFIYKSIAFLFLLLISSYLINQFIFWSIKTIKIGDIGVLNRIVDGKINTDILIIGSSRGYVDFDPDIISKYTVSTCYNISQNGTRFGVQLPLLKTYLRNNKPPKVLIQEIGVYSLSLEEGILDEFKYIPYFYEEELYKGLLKINKNLWMQKYIPLANLYYFNSDFQSRIFREFYLSFVKGEDYLIKGYHPNEIEWSIDEEHFLKTHPGGLYNLISDEGKQYLNEIINLCKEYGIKLVLTNTPEYHTILPIQNNREWIINYYKNIAEENSIFYLDYTESEIGMEKKYFYNFTHLNKRGAEYFSEILANDLISKNIIKKKLYAEF